MRAMWLVGLAACGRVHFETATTLDASADATPADADPDPAMLTPSCMGLPATSGSAGDGACCGSPLVEGGAFFRSHDVATDGMYLDMSNPATLSSFRLDRYEVTVARYRRFVAAGLGTQQSPPSAGAGGRVLDGMIGQAEWDPAWNASLEASTAALTAAFICDAEATWTDAPGANENVPMSCVTWYEAFAFCAWDGGFLATEAEWNYAAVGGSEHRAYPWSTPPDSLAIDCTYANYNPGPFCVTGPGTDGFVNRVGSASPKGDGRWGHADLAGSVWEWTLDWYVPYVNPCNDCAALTPAGSRTFRGGSYFNTALAARSADRNSVPPTSRYANFGIRCARHSP